MDVGSGIRGRRERVRRTGVGVGGGVVGGYHQFFLEEYSSDPTRSLEQLRLNLAGINNISD